jgi:hypothetical protein
MSAVTPINGTPKLKALMQAPNAEEIAEAAREIERLHRGFMAHLAGTIDHAMVVGDALIKAKPLVGHGRWGRWLCENTSVSESECQRYMQLARNREVIEAKAAHVRDLTIGAALKLIAKPREESTPPPATQSPISVTRSEKKLRVVSEAWHELEPPERQQFLERVAVEARLTPAAIDSPEHRLAKAEDRIAELEAELETADKALQHHEVGVSGAEQRDTDGDLLARRQRQLADLGAAWERADSAVRQTFFRRINAEAPELTTG